LISIKNSYEKNSNNRSFFTSIGFAQKTKIEFKAENNTIDYGTITKGRDMALEFEFTNTGTPLSMRFNPQPPLSYQNKWTLFWKIK
jgi:hypothetical protein